MTADGWVSYKLEGRHHGSGDPSTPLSSLVSGRCPDAGTRDERARECEHSDIDMRGEKFFFFS